MRFSFSDFLAYQAKRAKGKQAVSTEGCDDESKLHQQIIDELKRRGWYYVHSRMDMRTTQQKGVPDFVIAGPSKTYWVEAKAKGKKLTPEQAGALHWLNSLGHVAVVVYSLEDFLLIIS